MEQAILFLLLLAVVIVAAYFYLKRRQQHVHVDTAGQTVEHRHERDASDVTAHDHPVNNVNNTDLPRDR
jgi:hypothetical protein